VTIEYYPPEPSSSAPNLCSNVRYAFNYEEQSELTEQTEQTEQMEQFQAEAMRGTYGVNLPCVSPSPVRSGSDVAVRLRTGQARKRDEPWSRTRNSPG